MIDWPSLGLGALWVLGLALVLAVACYAGWAASRAGLRLRQAWQPHHDLALNAGACLVALALALGAGAWWERLGGALSAAGFLALAAYAGVQWWRGVAAPLVARPADPPATRWPRATTAWRSALFPLSLGAVFLTLLGARPALAGVGLLLAAWLLGRLACRRPTLRSPLDWPLALLLMMALVGTAVSVDRALSVPILRSLFGGVALLLAVAAWADTPRRVGWAAGALVLAGCGLAVMAPFSRTAWMSGRFFEVPAAVRRLAVLPETIHTNVLAGALALALPVAVSLLLSPAGSGAHRGGAERKPGRRWPACARGTIPGAVWRVGLALACGLLLGVLVLTQSRGGLLACAASLAALALLRWRPARFAAPALAAGAGVAVWRLGAARVLGLALGGTGLGNLEGRLEVWSRAIYMLEDFSFTGIGLGTFVKIAPVMYPFFIAGPDAQIPHAHNLFLQVGVDLGLPGLVAFLALLILSVSLAWQVYTRCAIASWRALAAGLLAGYVALVAHGLVDAAVWGQKPSFVLWLLFGLTVALWNVALGPGPVSAGVSPADGHSRADPPPGAHP